MSLNMTIHKPTSTHYHSMPYKPQAFLLTMSPGLCFQGFPTPSSSRNLQGEYTLGPFSIQCNLFYSTVTIFLRVPMLPRCQSTQAVTLVQLTPVSEISIYKTTL